MKRIIGFLFILSSCSGIIVSSDYDRDVNMKPYNTYAWAESKDIEAKNNPLYYNELSDKRIKTAVNKQLTKKGYVLSTENPHLILHYHILIEDHQELRNDPYVLYGPYWMQPHVNYYRYNEGSLLIDFMEAKTNNLAWRGWASSVLDFNHEMNEALIQEAVMRIIKVYPFEAGQKNRK
jgi:hypothetical protein